MLNTKNNKDLNNKIRYMLSYLKKNEFIKSTGNTKSSKWMINNK